MFLTLWAVTLWHWRFPIKLYRWPHHIALYPPLQSLSLYSFIHEGLWEGRYLSSDDSQWGQDGFLWKWHLSCTFLYLWASVSLCWLWYTGPVLGSGGMSQYPTQPLCCGFSVSPEADQPTPEKEATDYGGGLQSPTTSLLCDPGQVGWPLSVPQLSSL